MQMQLATKSKGQRDDITVIVIDALPAEDMRLPPALQAKKSGSTMIARHVTLTVLQLQLKATRAFDILREGNLVFVSSGNDTQTGHWCRAAAQKCQPCTQAECNCRCLALTWCSASPCRSAGSRSLSSSELLEAMSGTLTDQVTVLKPLEIAHHDALWRAAVW